MYSLHTDFSLTAFLTLEYGLRKARHLRNILVTWSWQVTRTFRTTTRKEYNHRKLCGIHEKTWKGYRWCHSNKKLIQYLRPTAIQNGFVHNLYLVVYVQVPSKKQLPFHNGSFVLKKKVPFTSMLQSCQADLRKQDSTIH